MNQQTTKYNSTEDEVDLSVVFSAINNFFKKIALYILSVFVFIYKHKFILLGLIILGAVAGYFWEENSDKTYTNDLLITPNFKSTDYVYGKVEAIEYKIKAKDSIFLEEVFGKNYTQLKSIEITPVVEIYDFLGQYDVEKGANREMFNLFELLFEEAGDMEFLEDPINSVHYTFHNISLKVKEEENHEELSQKLIAHFNANTYFGGLQVRYYENLQQRILENKSTLIQIDSIIEKAKDTKSLRYQENNLSFSDNRGLYEMLKLKDKVSENLGDLQKDLLTQTKVVKLVDANYKVLINEDLLSISKTKLLPLLLLLLYFIVFLLRFIINKSSSFYHNNQSIL